MNQNDPPSGGLLDSLRRLCDRVLALAQNRIALFGVELEEQKTRLVRVMIFGAAAVFLVNLAAGMTVATIVILVGEEWRTAALIGFSLVFIAAAVVAVLLLRKEIRSAPPPFHGTLSEMQKDRQWFNTQD